ncbi:hypothetical protein B0T20DRAFT_477211 [Sordaria brevicollis]|uniref:Uncharacterized protein n=1 Tax=Sordaria brevicollis TaxID=83679 RepID=A0AAE0PJL8_SORBR|nr:hypothetical protein B0T20DRAFT_477211 [Sordaria brevicollis]
MASEAKPPILAAPLEIRHAIYRYTWTITREEVLKTPPTQLLWVYEMAIFKLKAKRLYKLTSICKQMSYEVLSEYFHRRQIWIRTWNLAGASEDLLCPMNYIQSSSLFTSYTQHVSFAMSGSSRDRFNSFDWLLQLKQLKTLELVINDLGLWTKNIDQDGIKSIITKYFGPDLVQKLAAFRNLEKLVIRFGLGGDRYTKMAEGTTEFQRIKDILSQTVREDLRQPEMQPTYKFEQNVGAFRSPYL